MAGCRTLVRNAATVATHYTALQSMRDTNTFYVGFFLNNPFFIINLKWTIICQHQYLAC